MCVWVIKKGKPVYREQKKEHACVCVCGGDEKTCVCMSGWKNNKKGWVESVLKKTRWAIKKKEKITKNKKTFFFLKSISTI